MRSPQYILVILGALATLGSAPHPYTNQANRFTIVPPEGWITKQSKDAIVVFMEPMADQHTSRHSGETTQQFLDRVNREAQAPISAPSFRADIAITVVKLPQAYTLDEYARETRRRATRLHMYRVQRERSATLGGVDAIERTVRVTLSDGSLTTNREMFCIQGGTVFTIGLASAPADFRRNSALFDRAVASFRWTK